MEELGLSLFSHMDFQLSIAEYLVEDVFRVDRRRKKPCVKRTQLGRRRCKFEKGFLRRLCIVCCAKERGFCQTPLWL